MTESPPAVRQFLLFALLLVGGGAGALGGSILGAALGRRALFAGGVLGGLAGSAAAAFLAAWLEWIERTETKATAAGAAAGFLAAASVAVSTLHSPVGPVLSTLLIGAGGLIGLNVRRRL